MPPNRPGASPSAVSVSSGTARSIATRHASALPTRHKRRASSRSVTAVTCATSMRRKRAIKSRPWLPPATTTICDLLIDFINAFLCHATRLCSSDISNIRPTEYTTKSRTVGISFFFQHFLSIYSPMGQTNCLITDGKSTDIDQKGGLTPTGCRTVCGSSNWTTRHPGDLSRFMRCSVWGTDRCLNLTLRSNLLGVIHFA
jgi:hypothetical protein